MRESKRLGGGYLCRLPCSSWLKLNRSASPSRGRTNASAPTQSLRGLAWAFTFDLLFRALRATDVDLDLLRLGFRLLGQIDLQDSLVVARRDVLGVHGLGQSEGAGEAAILTLHAAIVLFFLFLLDLALAGDGQRVVFHADVDVFLF